MSSVGLTCTQHSRTQNATMEALAQCSNHSVGPANQLFGLLIQTLLAAQCSISPPDMWPKDFGPTAIENGEFVCAHRRALKNAHACGFVIPSTWTLHRQLTRFRARGAPACAISVNLALIDTSIYKANLICDNAACAFVTFAG